MKNSVCVSIKMHYIIVFFTRQHFSVHRFPVLQIQLSHKFVNSAGLREGHSCWFTNENSYLTLPSGWVGISHPALRS